MRRSPDLTRGNIPRVVTHAPDRRMGLRLDGAPAVRNCLPSVNPVRPPRRRRGHSVGCVAGPAPAILFIMGHVSIMVAGLSRRMAPIMFEPVPAPFIMFVHTGPPPAGCVSGFAPCDGARVANAANPNALRTPTETIDILTVVSFHTGRGASTACNRCSAANPSIKTGLEARTAFVAAGFFSKQVLLTWRSHPADGPRRGGLPFPRASVILLYYYLAI